MVTPPLGDERKSRVPGTPAGRGAPRIPGALITAALAFGAYLLIAGWLTSRFWPDPETKALLLNPTDQIFHEWLLAYGSGIWSGDLDLVTDRLNAPEGVNLMANTSIIALGALMAPVTASAGAPASLALLFALNLVATAAAWFLFFRRALGAGGWSAALAGAFCGFAPGLVAHSNAHPSMTAQFLIPPILACVIGLHHQAKVRPAPWRRIWKTAALLGLLVTLQIFVGEEVLFITAVTLAVLAFAYALLNRPTRPELMTFGAGLALAAVVAGCFLAYPLWVQFAGPQSPAGGLFDPSFFSADLASFPAFHSLSVAGTESTAPLAPSITESSTFFGWPLLALVAGLAIWLRRNPVASASAITLAVMFALSLGPDLVIAGNRTPVPGPFRLLALLPLAGHALPIRFALAGIPLIAVLLVCGLEKARKSSKPVVPLLVVVALAPLFPTQLPVVDRPPVPHYYSAGEWRRCASTGDVIAPVPLPDVPYPEPMRYAAAARARFAIPSGFFIGPYGADGAGAMGIYARPTAALLARVAESGEVPEVDAHAREMAEADARYWGARCLVLTAHPRFEQLRTTMVLLYGPGQPAADAVVWTPAASRE